MLGEAFRRHHRGMSGSTESTTSSIVWSWTPPVSARLSRQVRLAAGFAAVLVLGVVAFAAIQPGRASIVVAVMTVTVVVFAWQEDRRFRRTTLELSADGTLRIDDGRQSGRILLASADSIAVRRRTESGQSWTSATPRWAIEIAGPDAVLSHRIAHAAGLFNIDEDELRGLEIELRAAAGATADPSGRAVDERSATSAPGPATTSSTDRSHFEWRPPRSPKSDRRRRTFRAAYVGAALAIAAFGIVSEWGDPVGVILTATTVPGIVLVIGGSFDFVLGRLRKFRLVVDHGVLHVFRGNGERTIALAGADVSVDTRSHHQGSADGTTRTVRWVLSVTASDGSTLVQQLPSFGTTTCYDDYVTLERELKRRTRRH